MCFRWSSLAFLEYLRGSSPLPPPRSQRSSITSKTNRLILQRTREMSSMTSVRPSTFVELLHIGLPQHPDLLEDVDADDPRGLEVVAAQVGVLPGRRGVDHGHGLAQLQEEVVRLVQVFEQPLVEDLGNGVDGHELVGGSAQALLPDQVLCADVPAALVGLADLDDLLAFH